MGQLYLKCDQETMAALTLRMSDKILDKVLWLLRQFRPEDVEIISEDKDFLDTQASLGKELARIKSGEAGLHSLEEAETLLEKTIARHEG